MQATKNFEYCIGQNRYDIIVKDMIESLEKAYSNLCPKREFELCKSKRFFLEKLKIF